MDAAPEQDLLTLQLFKTSGDGITLVLAVGAAMSSAAFASYMWVVNPTEIIEDRIILQSLPDASQVARGLTGTRPIEPTVGNEVSEPEANQITTATTARADQDRPDVFDAAPDGQTQSLPGRLDGFLLLGIFGDTALIGSTDAGSDEVWPVRIGTNIPGAGRVISILPGEPNDAVFTTKGIISAPLEVQQ